jgi:hypothetical protein
VFGRDEIEKGTELLRICCIYSKACPTLGALKSMFPKLTSTKVTNIAAKLLNDGRPKVLTGSLCLFVKAPDSITGTTMIQAEYHKGPVCPVP